MWPIKMIFYVVPFWVVALIFCSLYLGQMTHPNASKIFFSGTDGQIYSQFGMFHWGLQPIIVCSYDDFWMTLTYFTARSILETKAFRWKKAKTMDIWETVAA